MNTCRDGAPIEPLEIQTNSPGETEALGEKIGRALKSGDMLLLSGTLGAGKTCLTRGLARGWGAQEQPTSPTFTLVNEYHRDKTIERFYHVDCYRMDSINDAISAGIEDLFGAEGVLTIEWPERIKTLLPQEYLLIEITADDIESRKLRLIPCGDRAQALIELLGEQIS